MNITEDMKNTEYINRNTLEDEGKVERCKHCKSLFIKEETIQDISTLACGSCGTVDYVEVVELAQHLREVNG